jgi:ribosomal-protein-alanine N-acetyltransferase
MASTIPVSVNPFSPFPELETHRFRLRALRPSDAEIIYGYFSDPRVTRFFGMEPYTALEQAEQFIAGYLSAAEAGRGIRWGVAVRQTDLLVGTCGFHAWHVPHRRAEIGYEVRPDNWRTGVMSEVLPAMLQYGFDQMNLNRIAALISPPNTASVRLIEKLGFQREGLLREYSITAGIPEDLCSYSLLRYEFAVVPGT